MRPNHSLPNHGQQNMHGQQNIRGQQNMHGQQTYQQQMQGPFGVWRDGKAMVVDTRSHVFQQRCVKTNQEYTGGPTRVFCRDQPNDMMRFLIGGIIYVLATSSKSVSIQIPLCEEYRKKRTRDQVLGYSALVVSILLILGLGVGYSFFLVSDAVMNVAIIVLPITFLFGLIYLAVSNRPILGLTKSNEHYVWLTGADPDYLDSLPPC